MKYPTIPADERKNQKLTVAQHAEIDYAVNTQHLGILFLAKKYKVSRSTIMYWSNPIFKAVDKINSTASRKRLMKDPVTRKRILQQMKNHVEARKISQPLFAQWMKSKKHYINRKPMTETQRLINLIKSKIYYFNHKQRDALAGKRKYRKTEYNGFRMFQKHINSVSYADNICHSKKETRSTSSYKTLDVSPTQSTLPMVRKLYISLLSILRKMLQPIHALRKGSLTTHK